MKVNKQAFFVLAALSFVALGHVSRATEPSDLPLSLQRKVALPVWNSIARTTPPTDGSSGLTFFGSMWVADSLMHDEIAPERLASAKAEIARQSAYHRNYDLADFALMQRMMGDEAGFRATQLTIKDAGIEDSQRKLLEEDRTTFLRVISKVISQAQHRKLAKNDVPAFPSDDLKPFIPLYYQILRLSKQSVDRAAMQKVIRQSVKRALALGTDSYNALELIALAQARVGDISGACDTAKRISDSYRALLHVARIQIDFGDLGGARQTLSKIYVDTRDPREENEVIEALAVAQLRAGNGGAALQALNAISDPGEQLDEKCQCLMHFLMAAHVSRSLSGTSK